jgi:hypothetical protein
VLLTRARYETIIYVPAGDRADPTRAPEIYDEIALCLAASGVPALAETSMPAPLPTAQPMLL